VKNEMELLNMDERQRLAWFVANRGTLMAVGAVWIGMIAWELTRGRVPVFLVCMVPAFALLRVGLYFYYSSRPFVEGEAPGGRRDFVLYGKIAGALLLGAAIFLPTYSVEAAPAEGSAFTFTWDLIRDDPVAVIPLAFTYLWPLLTLGLSRMRDRRVLQIALQVAEPVFAALSSVIVLWIPQVISAATVLFFVVIVPVNPTPEAGCYVAVAGNALYAASWLAGALRAGGVQRA